MNELSSQSNRASECAQMSSSGAQDFDKNESLSSFESDEDFVHSISSSKDDSSNEEDFSSVRQWFKIDSSSPAPSRFSFIDDVGMKACVTKFLIH
ncbi:hypothetical protein TNIN_281261 [Trichonephila inaurata madagascariensis]|uniref:Uncharacterized protein n=1 Tax=Trichonephila inaurata madagascariensis TaxID=2747483 RepID=A0A8X6YB64_9ARAC|nr:hypothetical protein TNIN_281261 [Trichonephila inaurata madagascariensis]